MQQLFSYSQASQEQLNDHMSKLSSSASYRALERYRAAGNLEMVRRIKLAIIVSKLRKLETQATELSLPSAEQ